MEINEVAREQIERIGESVKQIKPLVVIRCITYNHEPYIRDALEGFVRQKTNFPFVAIVHDDASTDGTANIIREYAEKYPDIIKPIYEKENQYSKRNGSLSKIMNAACEVTGAKYIAWCEGDDYWIDSLKLQKQVDFLESHPDYGLVYTKVKYYDQIKHKFIQIWGGSSESFASLVNDNTIPTLSTLFRKNIYDKYQCDIQPSAHREWKMGDYPIWLYFAKVSKIKFLPILTGVYRVLPNSASHYVSLVKQLEFTKSASDIQLFFVSKFCNSRRVREIYKLRNLLIILQINHLTHRSDKKVWQGILSCWRGLTLRTIVKILSMMLIPNIFYANLKRKLKY